jgi:hypothetical protein
MMNNKRPVVKLDSGRRVKSTFENEHYYFYNVRKESTAKEICQKLLDMGLKASVGSNPLKTLWYARVRHYDVFKD